MIKEVKVEGPNSGLRFPHSHLAHQYLDGLQGVEFGAASHNSFFLDGSINIVPEEFFEFYKKDSIAQCGAYAEADAWGFAEDSGLPDASQDYVITSHVVEHIPDPVLAFREWQRILKPDGIVFMIVPLRDALPADRDRPVSSASAILKAHEDGVTAKSWDYEANPVPGGEGGHYWVYTIEVMRELVAASCPNWELLAQENPDTKVGNGFTLVYRVHVPVSPKLELPVAAKIDDAVFRPDPGDVVIPPGVPDSIEIGGMPEKQPEDPVKEAPKKSPGRPRKNPK